MLPSEPHPRTEANRRLTWLAGGIAVWAFCLLAKLISLQVVHHGEYAAMAHQQQEHVVEIPAPRGTIFDRSGQPLAMSVPMDSVFVNPLRVPDLRVASEILSSILSMDRNQLFGRMKWYLDNHRGFMWVKRRISPKESERLRSLKLDWIELQTESQRHYPGGTVAAHVLGSVDREEHGNWGIEAGLDSTLEGIPGTARMLTDVKRRGIESQLDMEPHAGTSITLTIDARIQFAAEKAIARAVEEQHAQTGSVVVMNPYNGEVLALASYPPFDPNKPPHAGEPPQARINHAVSAPFEPGSVFKVMTLSAALETTNLTPDSIINCGNGTITLFGRTIHEAHGGYGAMPMSLVLAKSSNIGAIQIGLRVGQNHLYDYVRRFGFGRRTGIELPAESPGMLRKLSHWQATSLPSVAMGHEVSVTTVQLAQACSIVANGGLLVKPKIILRKGGAAYPSQPPHRVIQPETAITMRRMMEGVVVLPQGTGHRTARLEGYSSGGKTGSAQIYDYAARHYTHSYNASFMGFAPVTNPAIVVVATVNGTHGTAGFGGVAAGPVFRVVAQESLRVLDVPRDLPDTSPNEVAADREPGDAEEDAAIADLADPGAAAEEAREENHQVVAAAQSPAEGPRAPDFQGMTMRAVITEASQKGVQVLLDGSGTARVQEPPPGTILRAGERIRVQFGR
jgi:cell division protein FtsI (penicillin-binding protein 3)